MKLRLFITFLSFAFIPVMAMANPPALQSHKTAKNLFYCPAISALSKDPMKQTWSTKNGQWKSYATSFVQKIKEFDGAQWVGTKVGQITCIYRGEDATAFPILLIFHTLALTPSGGKWERNLGGYKNCQTKQQKQCAFKMQLKPSNVDIFKEAEKLKGAPSL